MVKIRHICAEDAASDSNLNSFICNADRRFYNCEGHSVPEVLSEGSAAALPRDASPVRTSQVPE